MLEPWIPYKGNKAGIMDNIWASLRSVNMPEPKGFVCPFCGGGAFEYFLAQHGYKVLMSDIEKGVVDLHKLCASKEGLEILRSWKQHAFTKEQFNAIKNEDTAFSAYVRSLWSFSNDGKTYLTSLENQDNKIQQYFEGCAEPNTRYKHIEDICILFLQKEIDVEQRCCSYQDIEIPEGFVCYCDPPYAGTWEYKAGGFDHQAFYDWCLKQKALVFISEYSMPDDFFLVDEYFKFNEGGGALKRKPAVERLYANKPVHKLALF